MTQAPPAEIEQYLAGFPAEHQQILREVRRVILEAIATDASPTPVEKLRYGIPAVQLEGRYWFHFAGWKKHVGLYPMRDTGDAGFEAELAPYRAAKDSLNFRYDRDVPYELISRCAAWLAERHPAG